jgi:hypothetical protein
MLVMVRLIPVCPNLRKCSKKACRKASMANSGFLRSEVCVHAVLHRTARPGNPLP